MCCSLGRRRARPSPPPRSHSATLARLLAEGSRCAAALAEAQRRIPGWRRQQAQGTGPGWQMRRVQKRNLGRDRQHSLAQGGLRHLGRYLDACRGLSSPCFYAIKWLNQKLKFKESPQHPFCVSHQVDCHFVLCMQRMDN